MTNLENLMLFLLLLLNYYNLVQWRNVSAKLHNSYRPINFELNNLSIIKYLYFYVHSFSPVILYFVPFVITTFPESV